VPVVRIRARVDAEQRRELMQMCKSWISDSSLSACLERRVYEDVHAPTDLLLVEVWSDEVEMRSYLSTERFRALIGAVKVLGNLVDVCICQETVVEGGGTNEAKD